MTSTSSVGSNYIFEYWDAIESGKVIVSQKVYKQYKKLVDDILNPKKNWIFDNSKAHHAINFIEKYCKHSKGKFAGKPLILDLWQKALVSAMFGFIDKNTGKRKYKKVMLVVARKNGKSTLAAAVGLYLMFADGEGGAEIYAAATTMNQAKIIWLESRSMIKKSPELDKRAKCLVNKIQGLGKFEDNVFRPLGADSSSLDGLNVHGALLDEIHEWKDKNLLDVIHNGTSIREQPMIFLTTTAGFVRELVFDDEYKIASETIDGIQTNETLLPIIYEIDDVKEWTDPKMWQKANPGLGTIKKVTYIEEEVLKAKQNPKELSNTLTKDFNIRTSGATRWMSFHDIDNPATFNIEDLRDCYAIGGADLSSTTDLTCATLIVMKPNDPIKYVLQMYFLPEELLEKNEREDKIKYSEYRRDGWLRTSQGHQVDYRDVTKWFVEMYKNYGIRPLWIYYDRALAGYWAQEMENNSFNMVKCAQGAMTFSNPMKNLEADLKSKVVNYNNNPVLKWCLSNTEAKYDDNENVRPVKGLSKRKRIDGMVSLLDAYVGLNEHLNDIQALNGG